MEEDDVMKVTALVEKPKRQEHRQKVYKTTLSPDAQRRRAKINQLRLQDIQEDLEEDY
jgi:hypothetical protein